MAGLLETLGKSEWCVEFSKTLDSETNQEKCLQEIRRLIPMLQPDFDAQQKAKHIASNCMDKFVEFLHRSHLA